MLCSSPSQAPAQTLSGMDAKLQKEFLGLAREQVTAQLEIASIFRDNELTNKRYQAYKDKEELLSRSTHPLDRVERQKHMGEASRLKKELDALLERTHKLKKKLEDINERFLRLKARLGNKAA